MADYLQALYDRLYRNPLGTYSPDETGDSPLATSAPVMAAKRNLASFNAAQPYPQSPPPPWVPQLSTNLSQGEVGGSPFVAGVRRRIADVNAAQPYPQPAPPPLPTQISTNLSQGEVGGSPFVAGIRRNIAGVNAAQPYPPASAPPLPTQISTNLSQGEVGGSPLVAGTRAAINELKRRAGAFGTGPVPLTASQTLAPQMSGPYPQWSTPPQPPPPVQPPEPSTPPVRPVADQSPWLPPGVQPSATAGPAIKNILSAAGNLISHPANPSYGKSPMSISEDSPRERLHVPDPNAVEPPTEPREVDGYYGGKTEGERLGVHDPHAAPGEPLNIKPPVQTAAGGPQPPAAPAAPAAPAVDRGTVLQADGTQGDQGMGQRAGILGGFGDWLQQHSNTLLAISAGLSGAPGIHAGIGRAAAYTMPAAQQDIAEQMQRGGVQASYNALIAAGVPPDLAKAGAVDKDVMKQLMASYVTNKTQSVDVKLPNGMVVTAQYDPFTHTYTDVYGRPFDPNAPGMGGSVIDPNLTGEEARAAAEQSANPATYRQAMAYVSGQIPLPVGRAATQPMTKMAYDLALQIDPKLGTAEGKLRNETLMDYGPKGKTGQTRLALSNMMGHAEQLDQLNKIIGNWDLGGEKANWARNALYQTLGANKTYLDAKAQADLLRDILGGEANKAFSGSHSVTGSEEMIKALGGEKGYTSQHGAIKGMIHAAGTRLGELQSQFDSSLNTRSEGFHMLSPKAQRIFRKWEGDAGMDWSKAAPGNLPEAADSAEAFAPAGGGGGGGGGGARSGTAGPGQVQWSIQGQ